MWGPWGWNNVNTRNLPSLFMHPATLLKCGWLYPFLQTISKEASNGVAEIRNSLTDNTIHPLSHPEAILYTMAMSWISTVRGSYYRKKRKATNFNHQSRVRGTVCRWSVIYIQTKAILLSALKRTLSKVNNNLSLSLGERFTLKLDEKVSVWTELSVWVNQPVCNPPQKPPNTVRLLALFFASLLSWLVCPFAALKKPNSITCRTPWIQLFPPCLMN